MILKEIYEKWWSYKHSDCLGVRGVKLFNCVKCNKETNNYLNGINICKECCKKENICQVCENTIEETLWKK